MALLRIILLTLLASFPLHAFPQDPPKADRLAKIQRLSEQKEWNEVEREVESTPTRGGEIDYLYGSALAHLGRWSQAHDAFVDGRRLMPRDERFPIELGGVAFKQQRYAEAARWLREGLRLAPKDDYANDFLATIYFLQGNIEAALKYWNRVSKPRLENVHTDPNWKVDPALLNRAFLFAPAGTLRLPDFLSTQLRVEGLGIFPAPQWRLNALDDGNFDLDLSGAERNGLGEGKLGAVLATFRGVFYQTAYPEYFNLRRQAINVTSLVRWDAEKRRLTVALAGTLSQNPKYRYEVGIDLRNENWDLRAGSAPVLGALNLRRYAVSGQVNSFNSGRWNWLAGAELSNRDYRNVFVGPALPAQALASGVQLKQRAQVNYQLLRVPERRLESTAVLTSEAGTIWSSPTHTFEKLQGAVSTRWLPQMNGDDYAMEGRVRSGRTFGSVPFDELYMLGVERDNDLWMRAHAGTRDGIKGSAPLGRNYFLANWEIDKRVYHHGFFTVKLSPLLDSGKITDSLPGLGSERWLWDAGIQAKLRVMGVGVTLIYGKDLRTGRTAFYATAQ